MQNSISGESTKKRFYKKVAIITGAGSGIGRETALRLGSEDAELLICDINEQNLNDTLSTCHQLGFRAEKHVFDVSEKSACEMAVKNCLETFGKLDVLCNIAGFARLEHFTDVSINDWQKMLNVNLSSVFYMSQLAIPHLVKTKGNIVNIASSAGLVGQAYTAAYSATKAAIVSLSKSLAIEYSAKSVRVNAICPGNVKTPLSRGMQFPEGLDKKLLSKMFPLLDAAEPIEIASAIAYVASDEARYITGAAIPIDGGQTAG